MSAKRDSLNRGINVRRKNRDKVKDDDPAHINWVRQCHNSNGKQHLDCPGKVNQGASCRHKRRQHRNHLLGLKEMAYSGEQEHQADPDSPSHHLVEVKDICDEVRDHQQREDDSYVCHVPPRSSSEANNPTGNPKYPVPRRAWSCQFRDQELIASCCFIESLGSSHRPGRPRCNAPRPTHPRRTDAVPLCLPGPEQR